MIYLSDSILTVSVMYGNSETGRRFLFLGISLRNLQLLLYSNPKVERAVHCSKNSSFLSLIHPVETENEKITSWHD